MRGIVYRERVLAFLHEQWRAALLAGFIAVMMVIAIAKPGSEATHAALMNVGQFVGPLIAILWFLPGARKKVDGQRVLTTSAICLLIGAGGFVVGQSIWTFYEVILDIESPFPSWADAAFVTAYAFLFFGVLKLPSRPIPVLARWRILLDSFTSMAALVTFSWYFILAPQLAQGSQSVLGKILGMFYPLADLALLFCVMMVAGGRSKPAMRRGVITLSIGLLCIISIDTAFAVATLHNLYSTGGMLDLLWPLGYMLIGHGAWQLREAARRERAAGVVVEDANGGQQGPSLWQSLLPYAFMPPAIALLCFVYGVGGWEWRSWGVYGGAAVLMMLVLARQFFVVCENERLYRRLEDLHEQLKQSHKQLAELNRQLQLMATTDGLTQLPNRRGLQERLSKESARVGPDGETMSVLMIDVDHFKKLNDTHGHLVGDEVLKTIAAILKASVRGSDLAARYGGEEFVIVLPDAGIDEAMAIGERIRQAVAEHRFDHGSVTASIGVACGITSSVKTEALLRAADAALYRSKWSGRNRVTCAEPHLAAA